MKILELFCGTKSFSNVAAQRGHEVFTIDIEEKFNPDLCMDIMLITPEMILEKFGQPDVIWASPPCQKFSVMTIYRNWIKEGDKYFPRNVDVIKSIEMVKHTLDLIDKLKPKFWIIENPRAMLRKQEFMPNDKRKTITYCQYGLEYQKATDLWNNIESWNPKPMCSPKSPCHVRAPRGSKYGIQSGMSGFRLNRPNQKHPDISMLRVGTRIRNGKVMGTLRPQDITTFNDARIMRGIIPPKLCEEILDAIEQEIKNG